MSSTKSKCRNSLSSGWRCPWALINLLFTSVKQQHCLIYWTTSQFCWILNCDLDMQFRYFPACTMPWLTVHTGEGWSFSGNNFQKLSDILLRDLPLIPWYIIIMTVHSTAGLRNSHVLQTKLSITILGTLLHQTITWQPVLEVTAYSWKGREFPISK